MNSLAVCENTSMRLNVNRLIAFVSVSEATMSPPHALMSVIDAASPEDSTPLSATYPRPLNATSSVASEVAGRAVPSGAYRTPELARGAAAATFVASCAMRLAFQVGSLAHSRSGRRSGGLEGGHGDPKVCRELVAGGSGVGVG